MSAEDEKQADAGETPAAEKPAAISKGFTLRCPLCGDAESIIYIDLGNLVDLKCSANDCEFTTDDVRELIGQWQKLLAWLDTAPAAESVK